MSISPKRFFDPDPKFVGQLSWQASNFHNPVSLSFCGVSFDAAGKVKSKLQNSLKLESAFAKLDRGWGGGG
jgi:hypothetical protein